MQAECIVQPSRLVASFIAQGHKNNTTVSVTPTFTSLFSGFVGCAKDTTKQGFQPPMHLPRSSATKTCKRLDESYANKRGKYEPGVLDEASKSSISTFCVQHVSTLADCTAAVVSLSRQCLGCCCHCFSCIC